MDWLACSPGRAGLQIYSSQMDCAKNGLALPNPSNASHFGVYAVSITMQQMMLLLYKNIWKMAMEILLAS